jgi:hypothetical protein
MSLIIGHFLSDPSKRYRDFLGGYFLNFWNVIKNRAWFEKLQVEKRHKVVSTIFWRLRADDDGLVFNLINMLKRARKRGVLLLLS